MADRDAAFVGSIPANHDRYLGPLVARNLAAQLGDRPLRCALRALVFSARRPADPPLDGAGR